MNAVPITIPRLLLFRGRPGGGDNAVVVVGQYGQVLVGVLNEDAMGCVMTLLCEAKRGMGA